MIKRALAFILVLGSVQATTTAPYQWLEEIASAPVKEWLAFQDKLRADFFNGREELFQNYEITKGYAFYNRQGLPRIVGNLNYYLQQGSGESAFSLIEENRSKGGSHYLVHSDRDLEGGSISHFQVSPNQRYLLFTYSQNGSDRQKVKIYDREAKKLLPDVLEGIKFDNVCWDQAGKGLYYVKAFGSEEDLFAATSQVGIYFHTLRSNQESDSLFYTSEDPTAFIQLQGSFDPGSVLFHSSRGSGDQSCFYRCSAQGLQLLISNASSLESFLGRWADGYYFLSSDNAPRMKIVRFDGTQLVDVVSQSDGVICGALVTPFGLVLSVIENGAIHLKIYSYKGDYKREVPLPGEGRVGLSGSAFDGYHRLYFGWSDINHPMSIYSYDFEKKKCKLVSETPVLRKPPPFQCERIFYPSKDGTLIPLFVVHRKDLDPHLTPLPTILYGYGGFGISMFPFYDPTFLAWIERGGMVAIANLRGGGEFGEDWHRAGWKDRKQNVFDDFISVSEGLIRDGMTTAEKLAIMGRSNGGLLTAACMTQAPELFGAVVVSVGVLDMLRYHSFSVGSLWTEEFGSPDLEKEAAYLQAYSPLHQIVSGKRYPATLITTADSDDRVAPSHSFKFAAALQEAQGGTAPIILRYYPNRGHKKGPDAVKMAEECAEELTFIHQFTKE